MLQSMKHISFVFNSWMALNTFNHNSLLLVAPGRVSPLVEQRLPRQVSTVTSLCKLYSCLDLCYDGIGSSPSPESLSYPEERRHVL